MADESRPRLGRGLAALIGDAAAPDAAVEARARGQKRAPIEFLKPNPRNPRRAFDEEALEDLANSIREKGLLQPIVVRPAPGGAPDTFEIIAGERRWRAAQRAGLHDVPIVVVEASDRESLELAIVENVQRSDLNPLEEAQGYEQLAAQFGYSQQDIAKIIGKSRSHIANTLRLLKLPDMTRSLVANGSLSAGHARALLALPDPDSIAKRAVDQGLSVRDLEQMAQRDAEPTQADAARAPRAAVEKDADTRALEKTLGDALGLLVTIRHRGERGELSIRYKSLDQLDSLCRRLKG